MVSGRASAITRCSGHHRGRDVARRLGRAGLVLPALGERPPVCGHARRVPAAQRDSAEPNRPAANDVAGTSFTSGENLIYHGGQVLHSNQVFAIYWGSDPGPRTGA